MSSINLLDEVRVGGHRASVLATYSVYFPFYEEVVLRRLIASGCRHNILLVDARQVAGAFADPASRPRLAGHHYTLIPVRAKGAFHPKIALLGGPERGSLLVGSHNVTLAGFGGNRELTNRLQFDKSADKSVQAAFSDAWRFLASWAAAGSSTLPDEVVDGLRQLRNQIGWLQDGQEARRQGTFFGSDPAGTGLLSQMEDYLPRKPDRIIGVAPFFDRDFRFLSVLREQFPSAEIIVGVDPATADVSATSWPEGCRFVDAASIADRTGYLHAKALFFDGSGSNCALVVGSANLSSAAWGVRGGVRNAEAVVLTLGPQAKEAAERLHLLGVAEMPELHPGSFASKPTQGSPEEHREPEDAPEVCFALASGDEVTIPLRADNVGVVEHACLIGRDGRTIDTAPTIEAGTSSTTLTSKKPLANPIAFAELVRRERRRLVVLVHDTRSIHRRSLTGRRAQFHDALASLSGDSPDLVSLIAVVEKIIFEAPEGDEPIRRLQAAKGRSKATDEKLIGSMGVHVEPKQALRKARRIMRAGDFGELLDALIYQLGLGLESNYEHRDSKGRSEEEQVGEDDEEEPVRASVDMPEVVNAYHRKLVHLIGRLLRQLARSSAGDQTATMATMGLMQSLAVLGVVQELRRIDKENAQIRDLNATLVPVELRQRLFKGLVGEFFGKHAQLLPRARKEIADAQADELVQLPGLLVWLGWDAGFALAPKAFGELPEETTERLFQKALLIAVLGEGAQTESAFDVARATAQRLGNAADTMAWFHEHERWINRLRKAEVLKANAVPHESVEAGDVVCRLKDRRSLAVVASALPKTLVLFDPSGPDETREFETGFLGFVECASPPNGWPKRQAKPRI